MLIAVVLCSLLLVALPAVAAVILDLYPVDPIPSTTVGGTATVDLRVSGTYGIWFRRLLAGHRL